MFILDFPNKSKCVSALPIIMCMSTSNVKKDGFLFKNNENTYPKGRALMQMYKVVPQTKRGNMKNNMLLPREALHNHLPCVYCGSTLNELNEQC